MFLSKNAKLIVLFLCESVEDMELTLVEQWRTDNIWLIIKSLNTQDNNKEIISLKDNSTSDANIGNRMMCWT